MKSTFKGRIVRRLLQGDKTEDVTKSLESVDFFKRQMRVALRNCGVINPEDIDEYIAFDGYKALGKVLTEMTSRMLLISLKVRLKGRGGGGFPTGLKWEFAAKQQNVDQKYVCCNADEGDPGAFMDRSILKETPLCN